MLRLYLHFIYFFYTTTVIILLCLHELLKNLFNYLLLLLFANNLTLFPLLLIHKHSTLVRDDRNQKHNPFHNLPLILHKHSPHLRPFSDHTCKHPLSYLIDIVFGLILFFLNELISFFFVKFLAAFTVVIYFIDELLGLLVCEWLRVFHVINEAVTGWEELGVLDGRRDDL